MRVVVADTGPLRYLLAIGHIDILPQLFETISIPTTVHDELRHPSAPAPVRHWATTPPPWLEVLPPTIPRFKSSIPAKRPRWLSGYHCTPISF